MAIKSYQLGHWQVLPALNRLQSEHESRELEPRAMELLRYFCEHPGVVISRDELIEQVWKGAIVTDQAINRVISMLRKALGDDSLNPVFIATISKRGYRMVAEVLAIDEISHAAPPTHLKEQQETARLTEPTPAPVALTGYQSAPGLTDIASEENGQLSAVIPLEMPSGIAVKLTALLAPSRQWLWLLLVVSLIALSGVLVSILLAPAHENTASFLHAQALTSLPGSEHSPAQSPDGRFLVFSHHDRGESDFWQLQELDIVTGKVRRLTSGPYVDDNPVWSPDGSRLAFHRRSEHQGQILSLRMHNGQLDTDSLQEMASCSASTYRSSVAWSPKADKLYYTDAETVTAPLRIWELDITSHKIRSVTNPPDEGRGDYFIQAARSRPWLYFLRDQRWSQSEILGLNLDNGEFSKLAGMEWPLVSMSLRPDDSDLLYRDISGSFMQLTIANKQVRQLHDVSSAGINPVYMSDGRGVIFADRAERDRNISFLQNPLGKGPPLAFRPAIDSSQQDFYPSLGAHSSRLAFISTRSGLPQIWLQETDGSLRQLSDFDHYYSFSALHWSPDEQQILVQLGNELSLIQLANGRAEAVVISGNDAEMPTWSADGGSLFFSSQRSGQREIYRHELKTGEDVMITRKGGYAAMPGSDGHTLYFVKYYAKGLWRLDLNKPETEELVFPELVQTNPEQLALGHAGLFYLLQQEDKEQLLYQSFDNAPVQLIASLDKSLHRRFVVSGDERLIAQEVSVKVDTDLYRLDNAVEKN